jgi:hypothetical protein
MESSARNTIHGCEATLERIAHSWYLVVLQRLNDLDLVCKNVDTYFQQMPFAVKPDLLSLHVRNTLMTFSFCVV